MAGQSVKSIKGRVMRLTAVDECGAPRLDLQYGKIVTAGFISVSWEHEVEDGTEHTSINAWGDDEVSELDAPRTKWLNLSMDMCEVDPYTLVMLTGATPNTVAYDEFWPGPTPDDLEVGSGTLGVFFDSDANVNAFAIEVWTRAVGQECYGQPIKDTPKWGYFASVFVRNGMITGGSTIENGPMNLELSGNGFGAPADPENPASSAWGFGPYDGVPTVNQKWPIGAFRYIGITDVQPPAVTNGAVPIIDLV